MVHPMRFAIAAALPLLGTLALAGSSAADEMYRWVDASGNTHFGSAPPPGARQLQRVHPEKGRGSLVIAPTSPTSQPSSQAPRPASPAAQLGLDPSSLPGAGRVAQDGDPDTGPERYGGKEEGHWRREARSHRETVAARQRSLEQIEASERRSFATSGRSTNYDRIDRAKESLREAEDDLHNFEQRAREAEVPPSWLD